MLQANNPFVVRFYYSFSSPEKLFLVMEYCQGGDLASMLQVRTAGGGCLAVSAASALFSSWGERGVFYYFSSCERLSLVMEYCQGGDLASMLQVTAGKLLHHIMTAYRQP